MGLWLVMMKMIKSQIAKNTDDFPTLFPENGKEIFFSIFYFSKIEISRPFF